ncbi:MAG TPA: SelB C-terminal domain-containing protein, partial [Ktedonobacterales bacterium]
GSLWLAEFVWQALRTDALAQLATYHAGHPTRWGMPREEWRSRLRLGAREALAVLAALVAAGEVVEPRGGQVRLVAHEPHLAPAQEDAAQELLARYHQQLFAPPDRAEAERDVGTDAVAFFVERGDLVRVSPDILFAREAYETGVSRLLAHLRVEGRLTVGQARDLLMTTRKYIVPLLEHLDAQRLTTRAGDDRVLGPAANLEAS